MINVVYYVRHCWTITSVKNLSRLSLCCREANELRWYRHLQSLSLCGIQRVRRVNQGSGSHHQPKVLRRPTCWQRRPMLLILLMLNNKHVKTTCVCTDAVRYTLRHHGLLEDAIHAVYQTGVVNAKLPYALPAWLRFSSASDQGRIEAFLRLWESFKFGPHRRHHSTLFCASTDVKLFNNVLNNRQHLLFPLIHPVHDDHYSLCDRLHNHQLPTRSLALKDNNFLMRLDIHS